ncbi:MAG: TIR domain-containing protein [Anaerolineae bacterium]|nr:TIR domain-containing protein [Anaerolineae bacterium]
MQDDNPTLPPEPADANAEVLAVLEIIDGPEARVQGVSVGKTIEIREKRVTLGRNPRQVSIQLYNLDESSSVSRLHCTLEFHEALRCFFITDEGSSSGTKVAGRKLAAHKPQSLKDGDTIELGMPDNRGALLRFQTRFNLAERVSVEPNYAPKTTIRQNLAALMKEAAGTPTAQQADVFISYSRRDREQMHLVREGLITAELSVWSDEKLEPGSPSWKLDVQTAIEAAGCVVAILSPDAKGSEWVNEELGYARLLRKRVFTILVRGDEVNAVPLGLTGVQWVDMRTDYEEAITDLVHQSAMQQLITAIREHLGK